MKVSYYSFTQIAEHGNRKTLTSPETNRIIIICLRNGFADGGLVYIYRFGKQREREREMKIRDFIPSNNITEWRGVGSSKKILCDLASKIVSGPRTAADKLVH